jgi:hypothetical protein
MIAIHPSTISTTKVSIQLRFFFGSESSLSDGEFLQTDEQRRTQFTLQSV